MWICLPDAFFSIVEKSTDARNPLTVRARNVEHLQRYFPGIEPICWEGTDYPWRVLVPRAMVRKLLEVALAGITYDNFKDATMDPDLHRAYARIWSVMRDYQDDITPRHRPMRRGRAYKAKERR